MTKNIIITLLITITINLSCNNKQNQVSKPNFRTTKVIYDTTKYTIIEYNEESKWVFNKKCRKTTLTKNDLNNIEILFNQGVKEYNIGAEQRLEKLKEENPKTKFQRKYFIIDLDDYKRQYVAVLNQKNEKEVWINCFCRDFGGNGKESILIVFDGGNCFFNLKINLTTKKYYDFRVNGEA